MEILLNGRYDYKGETAQVLAIDEDPTALVMICIQAEPDRAYFVARESLTEIPFE